MAEYVLASIIMKERKIQNHRDNQTFHTWKKQGEKQDYRLLNSMTLGILGMGVIGSKIAQVCKLMGMRITGLVRTVPEHKIADEYFTMVIIN